MYSLKGHIMFQEIIAQWSNSLLKLKKKNHMASRQKKQVTRKEENSVNFPETYPQWHSVSKGGGILSTEFWEKCEPPVGAHWATLSLKSKDNSRSQTDLGTVALLSTSWKTVWWWNPANQEMNVNKEWRNYYIEGLGMNLEYIDM